MLLKFLRTYSSKVDISKVRNIGIIAHIDAGKTTTTERMLYYSGKINRVGNVDQGDTITDYLPQERSRGITIQSASISFHWHDNYKINLIDTPGHADFTFEVIRSLNILDGSVTILDAVAGVESQTEKVWKQSEGIPKICFINKMDRIGAGYSRTVKELIIKMKTRVLLLNTPIVEIDNKTNNTLFQGVMDIVNGKILKWDPNDIDKIYISDILCNDAKYDELLNCRESLIETLSEIDDELVEYFLEEAEGDYMKVPAHILNMSIRKATLAQYATPVLCGASFRNIGVQPLLDAIINYLPSPNESRIPKLNESLPIKFDPKTGMIINNNRHLCVSMAFKLITDPIRGIMVFIRVYSGILTSGHTVYNSTTGTKFKIGKLIIMHANVAEEVKCLYPGDIGVLTGSNVSEHVRTGDTIISHTMKKDGIKSFNKNVELNLKINPMEIPPPVVSVAIQPRTLGNKKSMDESLAQLIREDPSLAVTKNDDTGQILLSGMGELHLEIATDRLLNELNAQVDIGKMTVAYKETINSTITKKTIKDDFGYTFTASIEPLDKTVLNNHSDLEKWYPLGNDNNYMVVEKHYKYDPLKYWKFQVTYDSIISSMISSCIAALQNGGKISNFPLNSCVIRINNNWEIPEDILSVTSILSLVRQLIVDLLFESPSSNFSVLEPIMNVEVIVQQQDLGNVIHDLVGARKANIISIEDEHDISKFHNLNLEFRDIAENQVLPADSTIDLAKLNQENQMLKVVKARIPLKEMVLYVKKLRSLTQGRGVFYMSYAGMEKVTQDRLEGVLNGY